MTIITGKICISVHPYFDIDMLKLAQETHQEKLIPKTHAGEFKRLAHQYTLKQNDSLNLLHFLKVGGCKQFILATFNKKKYVENQSSKCVYLAKTN